MSSAYGVVPGAVGMKTHRHPHRRDYCHEKSHSSHAGAVE